MKELKEAISPIINETIQAQRVVGASVIIAKGGQVIFKQQAGFADREAGKRVDEQTLFRLASMTKPIVSAAALAMVENGILDLDAPITRWLPEFTPRAPDGKQVVITVRHLLTHTSGLTYGFLSQDNEPYHSAGVSDGIDDSVPSLEENLRRLARVPLLFAPGSAWCYSLSTDVLGAVLEKASGQTLPELVEKYVTGPLEMRDTSFHVPSQAMSRLAKAYADADSKKAAPARPMKARDQVLLEGCGPIHYAPSRITNAAAYPSGGAGMVGTAADYLKFLEALRRGGHPILTPASVALLTQDAVKGFEVPAAGPGYGYGMGFAVVRDSAAAGTPRSAGSFEWGGVYGTKMFVDPKEGLTIIMLTNTGLEGLTGRFSVDITQAAYKALALQKAAGYAALRSGQPDSPILAKSKKSDNVDDAENYAQEASASRIVSKL